MATGTIAPARVADVRLAASSGLSALLSPKTIAVIGASRRPGSIGHQVTANLIAHGFTGAVYPVNPEAHAVCSMRAYPSVREVPERVDLAVVVVPARHVLDVAQECGESGVGALCVISAGFREMGPEGASAEAELKAMCRRYGMRLVGPNCMGVINTSPDVRMNATFAPSMPPGGTSAFVSQSGALGVNVLDYAREYGIGISQFVSVGNKADVSGNDLLLAWEHDPAVKSILMYVENFGNPRKFLEIASRITRVKPIIVVKSGHSRAGARAAQSHTGALAASDVAVEALLEQAGVLRAQTIEELFDIAMAFGARALPRSRRTAVLTNAGGPGILAADAMEKCGLDVVELTAATVESLRPLFPAEASIRNPLDMISSATPARYRAALSALLADAAVDAVVPIFVPPYGVRQEEVAEAIVEAAKAAPKTPLLAVLMGREGLPQGRAELHAAGIPAYIFPESAARALAALNRHREWSQRPLPSAERLPVDRDAAARILAEAKTRGEEKLSEQAALELLAAYGIPVPPSRVATGPDAAALAAQEVGFPVAMKVVSPEIVHKSDIGGVALGVGNARAVMATYDALVERAKAAVPGATVQGVLVERMVPEGRELIVGVTRDPDFGPLVMFGLGGIFVEALRDVAFRIAPIDDRQAEEMLDAIRGAKVLRGVRGTPPSDRRAIADVLRRVAQLADDFPEIRELDVNPLIAYPEGVMAADARVRIAVR